MAPVAGRRRRVEGARGINSQVGSRGFAGMGSISGEKEIHMRRAMVGLIVIVGLALASNVASAKGKAAEHPSGSVSMSEGSVAAGIGFSWGSGTLVFKGHKHAFSVDGLSVGAVGASKATASGHVYHLSKLEDFNGNYTAVAAGATVAGGGGVIAMQNQNGVVIKVKETTRGLKLTMAVDGVKIALK
jgi:hypothetical protein